MNELPLFSPEPQPADSGPVIHYDITLTTTIPITVRATWTEEKIREAVELWLTNAMHLPPGIEVIDQPGFEIYPDEDATLAAAGIPDSPGELSG